MKSLSRLRKNEIAPTRSSGTWTRGSARAPICVCRKASTSVSGFSSLSVLPGATQLTHTPSAPTSLASVFVRPRIAAFDVT
jgi:hypothetical protein